MAVQRKEQTVAAAVKQTAAVAAETMAEATTSLDSETTPAVVFSGSSFSCASAATTAGAAMEADAAVIMATAAGSSLSCFCFAADAAAITAAADLSGLFKAEVISSAFSDAQPFVFLCALFLFSVSDTPDLSHKRHCRPESASAFFHSISVTS